MIGPWFETAVIILLSGMGISIGLISPRMPKMLRVVLYVVPLVLLAILISARYYQPLVFISPFSWFAIGRHKFITLTFAVTIGLAAPLPQLRYRWEKTATGIIMAIFVVCFSILPFLIPAVFSSMLSELKTSINTDGICSQSRSYTCGPAAAVTALRQLGFTADEGEIALLARTSPVMGTFPSCLSAALEKLYGREGLTSSYRPFKSIAELKKLQAALVVVRENTLTDHCMAVLAVSDDRIILADPAGGKVSYTHEQFGKIWKYSGIALKRNIS